MHHADGSYSPQTGTYTPRPDAPGLRAPALFPDAPLSARPDTGKTLWRTRAVRLWSLGDDGVGILLVQDQDEHGQRRRARRRAAGDRLRREEPGRRSIWQDSDKAFGRADLKGMVGFVRRQARSTGSSR